MTLPVITLDIDWAPDAVIDEVASLLVDANVRATWFVTHLSRAVERLRDRPDLFELGLHPNFLPGSTHGGTPQEVVEPVARLVPEASSVRTHALVQSTPILGLMAATVPSLVADVSIYLPHAPWCDVVDHHFGGRPVSRVPYVWEDDFEMERPEPVWTLDGLAGLRSLCVMDFHPIHVVLNGTTMDAYRQLKDASPRLSDAPPSLVDRFRRDGSGPRSMFIDAVRRAAEAGGGSTIRDLVGRRRDRVA